MIIVTGGAGFIGSNLIWELNQRGFNRIIVVDRLGTSDKWKNLRGLDFFDFIDKEIFINQIEAGQFRHKIRTIFHLGACSSTTELDGDYLMKNNYDYSKSLLEFVATNSIRLIYASSAATYGLGERGFSDDHSKINSLKSLNLYGYSKHLIDKYFLNMEPKKRELITGLKFFNVYGPNEYHKGEMSSIIYKSFQTISQTGEFSLFKSNRSGIADGEQSRDFIYVKDVVKVMLFLADKLVPEIINVGTGEARSFKNLTQAVFIAMNRPAKIKFKQMPEQLKNKYQYYTCADISKLRQVGYSDSFSSIEEGVKDYVQEYLMQAEGNLSKCKGC